MSLIEKIIKLCRINLGYIKLFLCAEILPYNIFLLFNITKKYIKEIKHSQMVMNADAKYQREIKLSKYFV